MHAKTITSFLLGAWFTTHASGRGSYFGDKYVAFNASLFDLNTTYSNILPRWPPIVGEGHAGELKGPSDPFVPPAVANWIDCGSHPQWPHAIHLFHPPELKMDIPFNKPTDRYGADTGYPLDQYGRAIKGGPKKTESDPPQCCRPTWGCFELAWQETLQHRPWQEMRAQNKERFSKMQCCVMEYRGSCGNPQLGPNFHWNIPPLCSNWHN